MKKYYIILLLVLGASLSHAQQLEWAKSFGGSGNDEANAIAIDDIGNIYTTGNFNGIVDFDPGPGVTNIEPENLDNNQVFVSKLDENGNLIWAVNLHSTSYAKGQDIGIDDQGNIYIAGYYTDTIDVDPGIDTFNLISSSTFSEIFIIKLNSEGEFIWGKTIAANGTDGPSKILHFSDGEILITGHYKETIDFDPDPSSTFLLTSNGLADVFVLKLNQNGDFIWAKSFGGGSYDNATSISSDTDGNILVTGYFKDVADFDPGPGVFNLTSNGADDLFILKLNSNGDLAWAESIGGSEFDQGASITVDTMNNIYTCGFFSNTIDMTFGASTLTINSIGDNDALLLKFAPSGTFIWAKSFGSIAGDGAHSVTVDPLNNLIISGVYQSTMDLNPGDAVLEVTPQGAWDIFLIRLNSSGIFQWGTTFGGPEEDVVTNINADEHGNIYATGYFRGTANFDFPPNVMDFTSVAGDDVFIQKIASEYVGIPDHEISGFKLYPNPANGIVHLDLTEFNQDVTVSIHNGFGQLVHQQAVKASNNHITIQTDFPSGIYFVNLTANNSQFQQMLVIQ